MKIVLQVLVIKFKQNIICRGISRRGLQPSKMILLNFPKTCMKLRKFWSVGACVPPPPIRSAADLVKNAMALTLLLQKETPDQQFQYEQKLDNHPM